MSDTSRVRIEIGPSAIFTRVYIDGNEVRGITRVWFDSGDVNNSDGPRKAWRDTTRVHIEVMPSAVEVVGETSVDRLDVKPVPALPAADPLLIGKAYSPG